MLTKEKIGIIIKSYQREKTKDYNLKRRGDEIYLENLDQYIGQMLMLKIVQVSTGKVIKEKEIKINK